MAQPSELQLTQRAVAINAAILSKFSDPENGFTIEFQRAKGKIGTGQETLDALRTELDRTMPVQTSVQLGVAGANNLANWRQALERQREVLRGIIETMDKQTGVYPPDYYAKWALRCLI